MTAHLFSPFGVCDLPSKNTEEFEVYIKWLRRQVISSLQNQGFEFEGKYIRAPDQTNKLNLRKLHSVAVEHKLKQGFALKSKEPTLIKQIASGLEVDPSNISPRLVEVKSKSQDELLFRYAALHWSIPVSSGYGRRIRFLVMDDYNNKLVGIIGLGDPVFGLGARDRWIGWNSEQRKRRLRHVLDAYVLGAVPPYSHLLGGKLIAMLATSNEVRNSFEQKYSQQTALISGVKGDARVALLTTTSALGRSSMYNRFRYGNRLIFEPVGYTSGSGEFQFANGLYSELLRFAEKYCIPSAKKSQWGTGFRSRREVIRKALLELGLPLEFNYHGVRRQIFVAPLASNSKAFLQGTEQDLDCLSGDTDSLFGYFKKRWLIPRAKRDRTYLSFESPSYRLWG